MKCIILIIALVASIGLVSTASGAPRLSVGQAKLYTNKSGRAYASSHYWFTEADGLAMLRANHCTRAARLRISCAIGWTWDDVNSSSFTICSARVRVRLSGNGRWIYRTAPKNIRCNEIG